MSTNRRPWPFVTVLSLSLLLIVAACTGATSEPPPPPGTGLTITAAAGPTCPVERPGDLACAPRPVVGGRILVVDAQGRNVATVVTDANGSVAVPLSAGDYVVNPQPVEGLMGVAASMNVTVVDGALTPVLLGYDTGIR